MKMSKKLLAVVIATLVLTVAMCTTAFAVASIDGPGEVESGDTITVTISGEQDGMSANISTSGLSFVSTTGGLCDASDLILLKDSGGMSCTYTYRVTASAGETVSVRLSNVVESTETATENQPNESWSAPVVGPAPTETPTQTPTTTPTTEPSGTPTATIAPTVSPSGSASVVPTGSGSVAPTNPNQDKMPKTGDTTMDLWMIVLVAGACVAVAAVAGKKVFAKK